VGVDSLTVFPTSHSLATDIFQKLNLRLAQITSQMQPDVIYKK
jgi:hypothetical protein